MGRLIRRIAPMVVLAGCFPGLLMTRASTPAKAVMTGADLVYKGSFAVPTSGVDTCSTFQFSGGGIGYNPGNKSLFLGGSVANKCQHGPLVAEITIPAPVNSGTFKALNQAKIIQGFADVTQGLDKPLDASGIRYGGFAVVKDSLVWSAYGYYDATGRATKCMGVSSTDLSRPNAKGMYGINAQATPAGAMAGWIQPIPPAWQASFGNRPYYCGLGGTSIISRSSAGPAFVAFDPSRFGPAPTPGQTYLYYPMRGVSHPMRLWDKHWVSTVSGSCFVDLETKCGLLYFGGQPNGVTWYGLASSDKNPKHPRNPPDPTFHDPCSIYEGTHSTLGRLPTLWIYDPAAVAGAQSCYALTPVQFNLGGPKSSNPWYAATTCSVVDGTAFDERTSTLYLLDLNRTNHFPLIHVYGVAR